MDWFVINLLNALAFSFILFLIASGLSLVFGTMGILNLAHGSLYMLGAYFGFTLVSMSGNFILALLGAAVGAGILGIVLETTFLAKLYKQANDQVLLTLGFLYILGNSARWIWGPLARVGSPPSFAAGSVSIGESVFPQYRLVVILAGLVIAAALWFLQERTRSGAVIRAGMENKEMVTGLGVNYGLTCSIVFSLGGALAGMAGFLGMPILGMHPDISMEILLYALIVVVTGGVGYVQGALLGSVLIGFIDTFGKALFPDLSMFFIYLALIIILLVKPSGIVGKA